MSNKKHDIPPPSTKETLGLVTKRAGELSRYLSENYSDGDIRKFSISRNTNIEGDKWKVHSLILGLADILRLFLLSRDGIALYPIKPGTLKLGASRKLEPTDVPLRHLPDVSPNRHNAIDQAVNKINELFYGIGTPPDAKLLDLRYTYNGKPITRFEAFFTILYGAITHLNIEKQRACEKWEKAPDDLFSNLLTDFITTAYYISLQIIPPVAEASKQELQRLTS
jgi:hypothetical protein